MEDKIVRLYISDDFLKGRIIHLAPNDPIQLAIADYQPFVMTKDHKWFKKCLRYLTKEGSLEVWEFKTIPGRTILEPVRERFYEIKFTKDDIHGAFLIEKQQRHQKLEEAAEVARKEYEQLRRLHCNPEDDD